MKFLKIIFLLMSFICLLQADDSAKTLNLPKPSRKAPSFSYGDIRL
ncbi:hypothetical protein [Campylobacter coli]|nr:hypothetical protein [Campylobacter coli]